MLHLELLPTDIEVFAIMVGEERVGSIAWRATDEWNTRGHVSYAVAEEHRCKGYAKAAVNALLDRILDMEWRFDKVQICCAVDNVASRAVVEACGGIRDLSRGEIFKDPTDNQWTVSYWVPVKKVLDTVNHKD